MKPKLIYDVGMNTGEDAERYLVAGYNVVGIEADPLLCTACRARFVDEIKAGRLVLVEAAIAPASGETVLWRNRTKLGWSSIYEDLGMRASGGDMLPVEGVTFGEVIRAHGMPWYLKSDIEGADILCLEGLFGFEKRPKYISVELANPEWLEVLKKLGYKRFSLIDQAPFNACTKNPDLPEISGPLPTEIETWASLSAIKKQFWAGESWYDIYATR